MALEFLAAEDPQVTDCLRAELACASAAASS